MKIFLSYASEVLPLADEIRLAIEGAGHEVFFDRSDIAAGADFHARIRREVGTCDVFVFLISEDSLRPRAYTRTELKLAMKRWRHPADHVLPVNIGAVPIEQIPAYLRSVTVLDPEGNIAAEVAVAIASWDEEHADIDSETSPLAVLGFSEKERRRLVARFNGELAARGEEAAQLFRYAQILDQSLDWLGGNGTFLGISFREFAVLWSDPLMYSSFETNLLRYRRRGGDVYRTIVIDREFFDPGMQRLIVKTGMRQTMLDLEPTIVHWPDVSSDMKTGKVVCDMVDVINNKIVYYTQMSPDALVVRTDRRDFIDDACRVYFAASRRGRGFRDWLNRVPFRSLAPGLAAEVEREAELIRTFAGGA